MFFDVVLFCCVVLFCFSFFLEILITPLFGPCKYIKTELHYLSIMQLWEGIQIWEWFFMISTSKLER